MKFHESPDDITDVLREEPEAPGAAGTSAAINTQDFAIDSLQLPEAPVQAPGAPAAAAPEAAKEKVVIQEKTTTDAKGETVTEKKVITTQQPVASSEKSEAVARLFNPDTALLMFDIFLTRFGGIFTPGRPREYWSLTPDDRRDLGILAKESAREEGWTGIPTKWLLFGALGLMIGGKVVYARKMDYKFVPGEKAGDPKAPAASSGTTEKAAASSSTPTSESEYKSLFIREKARYEAELGVKNNSEELTELKKQNEYLRQLMEKSAKSKVPGGGISDADYVMLKKRDPERTDLSDDDDNIFEDSQGRQWNLDTVEFTEQEALLDKTKAGLPGWSPTGIKLGHISKGQHEAYAKWKQWRKKSVAA